MKGSAERVFVVDDEPAVRRSLTRLLRSAGFEAAAFDSPKTFLLELAPGSAGCAILDVAMPGLDGRSSASSTRAGAPCRSCS